MKIKFWGVRGSYPVPGVGTNKYGGNTSCLEVRLDNGELIILDAGTGIRPLGKALIQNGFGQGKGHANILFTHTHWDHIQGFPHFKPAYVEGNEFTIYARKQDHVTLKEVFAFQNGATYYPAPLDAMKAKLNFKEIQAEQTLSVGGATVRTVRLNHPNIALGYRIEADGKVFVYMTDTAPFEDMLIGSDFIPKPPEKIGEEEKRQLKELEMKLFSITENADFVVYDAFFKMDEYKRNPHWGHSTPEHGAQMCLETGAKKIALFHHAPSNTDDVMDQMEKYYEAQYRSEGVEVTVAMEGEEIPL